MLSTTSLVQLRLCFVVIMLLLNYVFGAKPVINGRRAQPVHQKIDSFPNSVILNLTFRNKTDDTLQLLTLKVPNGYTPKKKWPLLVTLHGLGDGPILATEVNSIVQIWPYGRGSVWFTGIGMHDVFKSVPIGFCQMLQNL